LASAELALAFAPHDTCSDSRVRKINILCDRLSLMGCLHEKHAFTCKELAEVINEPQQEFVPANLRIIRKRET